MALQTPIFLARPKQGGQALVVAYGADPYVFVDWVLTGNGTITPISNYSNAHGVACAKWDSTGATSGDTIIVTARVKT